MKCQLILKIDQGAMTKQNCPEDAEETPRVIGLVVNRKEFFFEVFLCSFHVALTSFEQGSVAPG